MKMKNLLLTMLLISGNVFAGAGDSDLYLRIGAGMGFSNFDKKGEKHDHSEMIFGGLRLSHTLSDKFELSGTLDVLQYNILNDLKNHPTHLEAKHENENLMLSISPKYILSEQMRVGPYLGRYLQENHITLDETMQDVVGLEMDYKLNKKWMTSVGVEESIDSSSRHRMAKLSIAYRFGGEEKKAVAASTPAPVCKDKVHVVHFAFDKDQMSKSEQDKLMDFMAGKGKVHVRGHADERGSDEYNYELAKRRALHVIGKIEDHVRSMQVLGEKEPLNEGYRMDRRVEVIEKCE